MTEKKEEKKDPNLKGLGPVGRKFMELASGRMIGQEKAVRRLAKALDQHASGLRVEDKPIYVSLVVGGAGSGKTLLAEILAEFWFGSPYALTTVSCSDFFQTSITQWDLNQFDYEYVRSSSKPMKEMLDSHNLNAKNRYEAMQNLAQAKASEAEDSVLQKFQEEFDLADKKFQESAKDYQPIINALKSIIVFDHIEDGKPNVQDELSKILEKGLSIRELEEGRSIVSFRNAVIFITCNDCVHPEETKKAKMLGFNAGNSGAKNSDDDRRYLRSTEEINRYFSPRLLSHLDRVEIFKEYTEESLLKILDIIIRDFHTELASKFPVKIMIREDVRKFIVTDGSDHPQHGIRLLKRKFDKYIRGQLAAFKCAGKIKKGDSLSVTLEEDKETKEKYVAFNKVGD